MIEASATHERLAKDICTEFKASGCRRNIGNKKLSI